MKRRPKRKKAARCGCGLLENVADLSVQRCRRTRRDPSSSNERRRKVARSWVRVDIMTRPYSRTDGAVKGAGIRRPVSVQTSRSVLALANAQFSPRRSDYLAFAVGEFSRHFCGAFVLMDETRRRNNRSQCCGLEELRIQTGCYGCQIRWQPGHDSVTRCGVQHRRQHSALHGAMAVREFPFCRESKFHFTRKWIDRDDLPTEKLGGWRHFLQMI
jgi:hypothetical protein